MSHRAQTTTDAADIRIVSMAQQTIDECSARPEPHEDNSSEDGHASTSPSSSYTHGLIIASHDHRFADTLKYARYRGLFTVFVASIASHGPRYWAKIPRHPSSQAAHLTLVHGRDTWSKQSALSSDVSLDYRAAYKVEV